MHWHLLSSFPRSGAPESGTFAHVPKPPAFPCQWDKLLLFDKLGSFPTFSLIAVICFWVNKHVIRRCNVFAFFRLAFALIRSEYLVAAGEGMHWG